jgi:hypothetical protein
MHLRRLLKCNFQMHQAMSHLRYLVQKVMPMRLLDKQ